MNSFPTKFGIGFEGQAIGVPGNSALKTSLGKTARTSASGAGWQCFDACTIPLTIGAGATTTLNLLTGLTNPLNEAISGAPFAHVYWVLVWHDAASLATAGITAFGGSSGNLFQGPFSSTAILTLLPGARNGFSIDTNLAGFVVDATHKNIDLTNLDGSHVATVNVSIGGKI